MGYGPLRLSQAVSCQPKSAALSSRRTSTWLSECPDPLCNVRVCVFAPKANSRHAYDIVITSSCSWAQLSEIKSLQLLFESPSADHRKYAQLVRDLL